LGAVQVVGEPFELGAPVGALAGDEVLRGRVDRGDAIELMQYRVL